MTGKQFRTKCLEVASLLNLEVDFFDENERLNDAFEDDGALHIQHGLLRACFDVSNDRAWQQNENTEAIMAELNLVVTDRVLVDDDSDNDEDDEDDLWNIEDTCKDDDEDGPEADEWI